MEKPKHIRPFLRWAGGKSWLVKLIGEQIAQLDFNSYHEPFLGGGALALSLPETKRKYLSDKNERLIEAYCAIQENVEEVIKQLEKLQNNKETYYFIRNKKFRSSLKKAVQFLYLNKTSFNGIYRVNQNGEYNVPFGYRKVKTCDPAHLRIVSNHLRNCALFSGDFEKSLRYIRKNDLVFIDPPYNLSDKINPFFQYNEQGFDNADIERLIKYINAIKVKGAKYIMTNLYNKKVIETFGEIDIIHKVQRADAIGGKNAYRGQIWEAVYTNIKEISL